VRGRRASEVRGRAAGERDEADDAMHHNTEVRGSVLGDGAGKSSECRSVFAHDSNSES
jgi:hypothetical protein